MKTEMNTNSAKKGLTIPAEIVSQTRLAEAERLSVYGSESCIVLVNKTPTAWEIINTVEMLIHVSAGLTMRLDNAAKEYETACRSVKIPEELLEMSGIPKGAPLDICAGEGEIYISVLDEEDDPTEAIPPFLWDVFARSKVDFGVLRHLLESEDTIRE